MSTVQASNGQHGTIANPVSLPASVSVGIGPATVTAPAAVAKQSGNIWYEAVQQGDIEDGKTIEQALLEAVVTFDGEVLTPAKRNLVDGQKVIAISHPRLYDKGHPQAGQPMPGTGGNQTISFVKMLPTWGERGYMLRVTLTGIEDNGRRFVTVKVACQTIVVGQGRRVGSVSGKLGF